MIRLIAMFDTCATLQQLAEYKTHAQALSVVMAEMCALRAHTSARMASEPHTCAKDCVQRNGTLMVMPSCTAM